MRSAGLDSALAIKRNFLCVDFHLKNIEQIKNDWLIHRLDLPSVIYVIEFFGTSDALLGGFADDRVLCIDGKIWDGKKVDHRALELLTIEAAVRFASLIPNRRENSVLGLIPYWD